MKSREIVKRAIHFQDPPRLPYNFDSNRTPEDGISYGEDMIWVSAAKRTLAGGQNEWGVVYETLDDVSFGEPKVFPLAGKESLDGYVFPDFSEDWRYEEIRRAVRENNGERYVLGMLPTGLFQHMIDLFGFNDFLINVGINPDFVGEVCDHLLAIDKTVAEKMAACGVDGILTLDDAALQDRLMISMEAFNTIFKPRFAKLYEHCHTLGLDTFIHSCGYTIDIIEEWIDAGCDVINLDQQDNMGIDELPPLQGAHLLLLSARHPAHGRDGKRGDRRTGEADGGGIHQRARRADRQDLSPAARGRYDRRISQNYDGRI